jgi:hypothetical protein
MSKSAREQMWGTRIAGFKASGMSGIKWWKEHDQKPGQLYCWVARFREADAQSEGQARWLEVGMRL